MRHLLLGLALFAVPVAAQTGSAPVATPTPVPAAPRPADLVTVVLTTSEGPITLALDRTHAPATTANFLRYVDARRFDGTAFYRAMKLGAGSGLIQGGLRNDPRRLFPPVAHEPTSTTGIRHLDMTISMARDRPGNATADFFITVGPLPSLDADPANTADPLGFAAFGHVTGGADIVRRIMDAPTSATQGVGAMKGQMLSPVVTILTARRAAGS